jgi:rubrerythrin
MRLKSVFLIPCECGKVVESHEPETKCPKCGIILVVKDWGKR